MHNVLCANNNDIKKFDDGITFYKNIQMLKMQTLIMTTWLKQLFAGFKPFFYKNFIVHTFQNGITHYDMI